MADNIRLFKVCIAAPVTNGAYYIVAEGFDAAAAMAMEMDEGGSQLRNGGVVSVEDIAVAGGPAAGFTITDRAAVSLGFA